MAQPAITAVPANRAPWDDLQTVLGERGAAAECQCQRFRVAHRQWWTASRAERAAWLRAATQSGRPRARETAGLVAYLEGEPVGWCAVEPRPAYVKLRKSRVPWTGRDEDPDDGGVWAVPCFITRAGFRRRGVSRALARAAVDHARARAAGALEGYPMILRPGEEIPWGELNVGSHSIFAAAGFVEVSRPSPRRAVMRIDF